MKKTKRTNTLIIFCFSLVIMACDILGGKSDSKSSDPPELPDLAIYQPDFSFFTSTSTQKNVQEQTGYELASELIFTEVEPFINKVQAYLRLLDPVEDHEANFEDDLWEWNYTHTFEGDPYSIRLTAEQHEDASTYFMWELYISSSSNQGSLTDYKLMQFSTRPEYDDGSYLIYPVEYQDPNITYGIEWSSGAEDYLEVSFYFSNVLDSSVEVSVYYSRDTSINVFQMHYGTGENFVILWNSDTREGFVDQTQYYQSTGSFICWDENLNDTEECQY